MALLAACTPDTTGGEGSAGDAGAGTEGNAASASITFKVASGGSETLPMYMALEEVFKPMVEENSSGDISVELYPSSQLGDDVKLVEQMRSGTLEASIPSTAPLVGLTPELAIFDMPFLFASADEAYEILDGPIGEGLSANLADADLINLGWGELGFRHLTNAVTDVRSPADVSGLRIRTQENEIHIETWKQLGANPTPMPISEVFTAIQQGALDGQENPVAAFYGWKIYEVNEHITLTGHVYSPSTFLVSERIWDTYDQATKDVLSEAALATVERSREISHEQEAELLAEMEDSGAEIIALSDEEKLEFQEATVGIWDLVEQTAGTEIVTSLRDALGHD